MIQNEVLECIRSRRSTRNFQEQQIKEEELEAAIWAPSGGNSQSWLFTAVQNKEALARINELLKEGFQRWIPDDDYPGKLGAKAMRKKKTAISSTMRLRSSLPLIGQIMKIPWQTVRSHLKTFS